MTPFVWLILANFVAYSVMHVVLAALAANEMLRNARQRDAWDVRRTMGSPLVPGVSVILPAHNEASVIADSVRALLALDYPTYELVIVNDGSTDDTLATLVETFSLAPAERRAPPALSHKPVTAVYLPQARLNLVVLDKEKGGKADALNAGINFARYPLVCTIDADSILEQDALAKTVIPFLADARTIVSGGIVRVANGCQIDRGRVLDARLPRNFLAMTQVLEYLRTFFIARAGWSAINSLMIVSGAFGMFRRDVVLEVGGYRTDTVGEDMELVVRLHRTMRRMRRPYRIVYVPDPVCWTQSPDSARVLRRQRSRWHRGSAETLRLHWRMLGNPRYGAAGLLGMPMVALEVLAPLVEVGGYVMGLAAWLTGHLDRDVALLAVAAAILYGICLSLSAVVLEDVSFGRHPGWESLGRVLLFAVIENLGYRQIVHLWRIEGLWQFCRRADQWGAMERRGLGAPPSGRRDEPAGRVRLPV